MKRQLLFLFLISFYSLNAQQAIVQVQNNKLQCDLISRGLEIGLNNGPFLTYTDENGEELSLMAATNLWLGGIKENGEIFISAPTYGSPSGISSEGIIPKVFQIDRLVIEQHIADWEDNGIIDNPDPDVFGWPGRGNAFFEQYNQDLELPSEFFLSAPFWDSDGNGIYNPENGDYPVLELRGCNGNQPIIPTQMNWCVYDIKDPFTEEITFYVKFNMFFFQCEEEQWLNNTLFAQHTLINASFEAFDEFYGGFWADMDLGNFTDDYVGTMPERFVSYVYNADNEDENIENAFGFGENPPVFGLDILRTPLDNQANEIGINGMIPQYNASIMGGAIPGTTDPSTIEEFLNYLQGNWRDGTPLTLGGSGYQTGEPTNFAFPDLPDQEAGWSAFQEELPAGDPRVLMNFGQMDYIPGAVNEVITAFSFYDDDSNHIAKVANFRDQMDEVQAFFDSCFDLEAFGVAECSQVLTQVETPKVLDQEVVLFPNPTSDRVEVKSDYPITQMHLIDATGRYIATTSESYLHVNALPKGIYFVQIEIQNQVLYKKLIVE